jgi:hypothetical protein
LPRGSQFPLSCRAHWRSIYWLPYRTVLFTADTADEQRCGGSPKNHHRDIHDFFSQKTGLPVERRINDVPVVLAVLICPLGRELHLLRISAIVDDCFSLIVDGVSTPSWTRGDARKRGV